MPTNNLERFLAASTEDRFKLVLDPTVAAEVRSYLGEQAFEEYLALAQRSTRRFGASVLDIHSPINLLFVPGIMGSLLQSKIGGVWWIDPRTRNHINDLKLAPNGQDDADARFRISAFNVDTTYEAFFLAVLDRDDFGYEYFPYDWRKPIPFCAEAFKNKVLEIYNSNGNRKVHLVAHSMGGLIVRAALMIHGAELWPIVGKIVFIGTPHYGSPSIAGYLKNHLWGFEVMAILGLYLDRETFRSLWGVLGLMPAPVGVYPGTRPTDDSRWSSGDAASSYDHPCANFDMYEVEEWKLEFPETEEGDRQKVNLQKALDAVSDLHIKLHNSHQNLDQSFRDRMAVIAGVGYKTLFRLEYTDWPFGLWERTRKIFSDIPGDPHRQGDGRVPLASASLENVGEMRYIKGVHGGLPMMSKVSKDVFDWLNGGPMNLPTTAAEALSQHLSIELESGSPNLDGTARADAVTGDPGYWETEPPEPGRMTILEAQLKSGQLPEFIRTKLF